MAEKRRKFDQESREGAARIVTETGKSIAEVAKDLGIYENTLDSGLSRAGATMAGESDELGPQTQRAGCPGLRRDSTPRRPTWCGAAT
ncbi:transposase [Streptomyces sp. NPDC005407]|uniref:transposase n=1 Tax=Streptomyces sp. NPDC005407 TaxID=3155340 RepID=UPI0033AF1224